MEEGGRRKALCLERVCTDRDTEEKQEGFMVYEEEDIMGWDEGSCGFQAIY